MPGFLERNKKHTEFVYFFRFGVRESEIYFAVFRFVLCLWSVSGCVRASPLSDKQICSTFHNLYVVHFFFLCSAFFSVSVGRWVACSIDTSFFFVGHLESFGQFTYN